MNYLNFESNGNFPINKYMSGTYHVGHYGLKDFSIPVKVIAKGKDYITVKPLEDIKLDWTGKNGDNHIETYNTNESIVVNPNCVSEEPFYPIPEFIKPDEYTISPKRANEIVENLIDTIILENDNINNQIAEFKKIGFSDNEITDLHLATETELQQYVNEELDKLFER